MSEYDDFDDFGNESFENDKKVKPAPPKASSGNAKAKADTPKRSFQEIDRSYEAPQSDNRLARRQSRDSENGIKNKKESSRAISKDNDHNRQQSEKAHVMPSVNSIQSSQMGGNASAAPGSKQSLIDKNLKLKQELKVLASELDTIIQREKQKREQRYSHQNDDSELKDRKSRVQKQVGEINKLKQNITRVKNQLENVYGNNNVVKKEDELQFLKKQILEVKTEYDGLCNVNEKQQNALQEIKSAGHSSANMARLRENLLKAKEEYRKLNEQVTEQEKDMRKQHEALVNKEDGIRQLNERIQDKKRQQNANHNNNATNNHQLNEDEIADKDIAELEEKIKEQEARRKNIEKQYQERQKQLEKEKKEMLNDQQRKAVILKGKEKEFKLNQIKLREVEKYIKNIRSKDDTKSVMSESHVDQMERENQKNAKNLKRPIVGNKKLPGEKAIRVEEEREVESDDDTTKKSSALNGNLRGRPRNSPNNQSKKEGIQKGQSKNRAAQPEEEVDLDDMKYGNEFEDYESRHSSKQEKREVKQSTQLQNLDSSNRDQLKSGQDHKNSDSPNKWKRDGDHEENGKAKDKISEEIQEPEEKKEEENVFAKPSFMFKKKK